MPDAMAAATGGRVTTTLVCTHNFLLDSHNLSRIAAQQQDVRTLDKCRLKMGVFVTILRTSALLSSCSAMRQLGSWRGCKSSGKNSPWARSPRVQAWAATPGTRDLS